MPTGLGGVVVEGGIVVVVVAIVGVLRVLGGVDVVAPPARRAPWPPVHPQTIPATTSIAARPKILLPMPFLMRVLSCSP